MKPLEIIRIGQNANRPKLDWQTKIFYSGSACMYPEHNQVDPR